MQNCMLRKGLVAGIIILFVGIAVAPSVTSIDITKNRNIKEKLSDLPCNCENKDIQSREPVGICFLLGVLYFITLGFFLSGGLFEEFLQYLGQLANELNCSWATS